MTIQSRRFKRLDLSNIRKKAGSVGLSLAAGSLLFAVTSCRKQPAAISDDSPARLSADVIAEVDTLYAGRGDLTKVRQGLIALRHSQATEAGNYALAWRLAKFNYYLGSHSPDVTERDKAFRDGIEAGKLAVKLQDGKPDGHFWLGANYGGSAKVSMLTGLSEIDEIKHEMETVLKLDEGYQAGSAYMVLGQVYLEAPRLLGGDTQKAIEYFQKGLQFGPNNALLRWHLAQAYADANRKEDARKEIDTLVTMKVDPGYEPEHKEALEKAQQLAEKLK
ncbi:MAG TPA: TRAP transporter TatT component family protein [Pyrinomonadaceae bacterium]|nr:TRAP transporter TatT component family protein [Pyrinomonadaceae bacterium]